MYSAVNICSMALIKLGSTGISSFSDGTTEAGICKAVYELVRNRLLSYRWRFATKYMRLSRLEAKPLADYRYFYALPTDFLMALSLGNEASGSSKSGQFTFIDGKIATDVEKPVLAYLFKIKEEEFPDFFVSALVDCLASEMAMPITGNPEVAAFWAKKADLQRREARTLDAQQSTPYKFDDNTLLSVR